MRIYLFFFITITLLAIFNVLINVQKQRNNESKNTNSTQNEEGRKESDLNEQETNSIEVTDDTKETSSIEEIDDTTKTSSIEEIDNITETNSIEVIDDEKNEKSIEEKYFFTAIYKSKVGQKIKAFNPYAILLKNLQYYIKYIPDISESENLRQIDEVENNDTFQNPKEINLTNVVDGNFYSPVDGFIKIRVYFTEPLTSLNFLFDNCEDLINVDLSTLNSPNITKISYTFKDCKNVEVINFTSVDTSNVDNMEFLFAGCNNLIDVIGLQDFNTSTLNSAIGLFCDCNNLQIVNLSSFNLDNIEAKEGIFTKTDSLQIVDLGNCSDANTIFNNNEDLNIIIIGNESMNVSSLSGNIHIYNNSGEYNLTKLIDNLTCITGKGSKCYQCNNEPGKKAFCQSCNYGYYLPLGNQYSKTKCKKCDEGCMDCYAEENSDISICYYCDYDYFLDNGTCKKYCEIGEDEKCLSCKYEDGKGDECFECNRGYYLDPNYSKSICKKVDIENCTKYEYNLSTNSLNCLECAQGYMVFDNKCYKGCEIGYGAKCKTCNPLFDYKSYCGSCNNGYYLYNRNRSLECRLCGIDKNCSSCENIAGEIVCTKCIDGYVLIDGKCFKNCSYECVDCYFDGINEGICLECDNQYFLRHYYKEDYYYDMSDEIDNFDVTDSTLILYNITYDQCEFCSNNCKTCYDNNIYWEYYYYYYPEPKCISCLEGYKLVNQRCVYQCRVGEGNSCLTCDNNNNQTNRCGSCNPNYYLNTTTGTCISCGISKCIKCNEKKECLECDIDYELFNNKCVKSCEKGSEEKCAECNNTEGHKDECLSCNDGYFLPTDSNKRQCVKCPDGCSKCSGTKNNVSCTKCESCYRIKNGKCTRVSIKDLTILTKFCLTCDGEVDENNNLCTKCQDGYYLSKDKTDCIPCGENVKECHENNGKIIIDKCFEDYEKSGDKCLKRCIIGDNNKCLSCNIEVGKINQCSQCNKGFFMPTDSINKEECMLCSEIGCIKCSGAMNNDICTECNEDYLLYNGKCIKDCEIGNYQKCKTCNEKAGFNNRCDKCNSKYYLPSYSTDLNENLICKECPSHCTECYGDYDSPTCTKCESSYILRNEECIEGCSSLYRHNCLECDDSGDFPKCVKCRDGYYFPSNNNKYYSQCYQCSIFGCKTCQGNNEYDNTCLECNSEYAPYINNGIIQSCSKQCEIGNKNKCKSCSNKSNQCNQCNDGFYLEGGMCLIEDNYDVLADYETTTDFEYVRLLNSECIDTLVVDGTNFYENYQYNYVIIEKPGIHEVRYKFKYYCRNSFPSLFSSLHQLKSIIFFDYFNSKEITYMNSCFSDCENLESVDLSNLDLSNNQCFGGFFKNDKKLKEVHFPKNRKLKPYYFYDMFNNCNSLTSIDLSSFTDENAGTVSQIFNQCSNVLTINIKSFGKTYLNLVNTLRIEYGLPQKGRIIINEQYKTEELLKDLPEGWVVEVDSPDTRKAILIAGDSTADPTGANDGKTNGWVKYFTNYIICEVNNYASIGQSARTFFRDGRWNKLTKLITKGDYVFIQFGHHDEGDPKEDSRASLEGAEDETITLTNNGKEEIVHNFSWYIKFFVNQVLQKEGIPILLSPTPTFSFVDGKLPEKNKYQEYMKLVADEMKITYIDIYKSISKYWETLGEKFLEDNNWFPTDNLHTSPEAANLNAKMIINSIKCQKIEDLLIYLNEEGRNIDYSCNN